MILMGWHVVKPDLIIIILKNKAHVDSVNIKPSLS